MKTERRLALAYRAIYSKRTHSIVEDRTALGSSVQGNSSLKNEQALEFDDRLWPLVHREILVEETIRLGGLNLCAGR